MEQYRQHRYPTQYPTKVMVGSKSFIATVIDVNQRGVRLKSDMDVQKGDPVSIEVLSIRVSGTVTWVRPGFVGVRFSPEIAPNQVAVIRNASVPGQTMRFSTAGLREL